jgi:membrane associated rhomboid family serine protease
MSKFRNDPTDMDAEKRRIKTGLFVAFYFVALIWLVKLFEIGTGYNMLFQFGILPREIKGLVGIITAPFVHSGFIHLFNNTAPLFISIAGIIYFFPKAAVKVLILIYLSTNILVWFFGRDSYHIGASGLVYGYISFLFFGSAFAKNKNMLVLALTITFIYGAMFWGILPQAGNISWESHLFGASTGFLFAIIFRNFAIESGSPEEAEEDDNDVDDSYLIDYSEQPPPPEQKN